MQHILPEAWTQLRKELTEIWQLKNETQGNASGRPTSSRKNHAGESTPSCDFHVSFFPRTFPLGFLPPRLRAQGREKENPMGAFFLDALPDFPVHQWTAGRALKVRPAGSAKTASAPGASGFRVLGTIIDAFARSRVVASRIRLLWCGDVGLLAFPGQGGAMNYPKDICRCLSDREPTRQILSGPLLG